MQETHLRLRKQLLFRLVFVWKEVQSYRGYAFSTNNSRRQLKKKVAALSVNCLFPKWQKTWYFFPLLYIVTGNPFMLVKWNISFVICCNIRHFSRQKCHFRYVLSFLNLQKGLTKKFDQTFFSLVTFVSYFFLTNAFLTYRKVDVVWRFRHLQDLHYSSQGSQKMIFLVCWAENFLTTKWAS